MGRRAVVVLALSLALPRALSAQVPTDLPGRAQEDVERQKKAQQASQKAAEESKKNAAQAAASGDVAYEQVMERPDDIELNYAFAKAEVRRGNLRSAAATLERMLMVNSDLPKIRLFYAVVLFRLDNMEDAERELETLKKEPLQPSLREELEDYIRQIHKRRRRGRVSVVLGGGFDFDENRNAAPAHGEFLIGDGVGTLDANSTRKNDTAETILATLGGVYDLGWQNGHSVFLNGTYYQAEQTQIKTINLKSFSYSSGFTFKSRAVDITPSVEFTHLELAQTTYLHQHLVKSRFEKKLGPRQIDSFGEAGYARQIYHRTEVVPTGPQRTGDQVFGKMGFNYPLTPSQNLQMSVTHVNQGALEKFDAYTRDTLSIAHTFLLGKGRFMLSSVDISFDRYERPELAISVRARKDDAYRARLTYGFPLGFIGKFADNAIMNLTYEYYQAFSNLLNYGYTNNKISSLLTYKWEM